MSQDIEISKEERPSNRNGGWRKFDMPKKLYSSKKSDNKNTETPVERNFKLQNFILEHINKYTHPELHDVDLWETFQEDFKDWRLEDFKVVQTQFIIALRNQLRRRGVLVQKGRGYPIAQTLYDTEIKEQLISDTTNFDSRYNPNRNNPNLFLIPEKTSENNDSLQTGQEFIKKDLDKSKEFRFSQLSPHLTSYIKELADMTKFYTEEEKYSGSQERFDFKLTIFKDICEKVNLPEDKRIKGLPIMLKGDAKKFYYQSLFPHINNLTNFDEIVNKIKSKFEGAEYQRTILENWLGITLDSFTLKSPEKPLSKNFEALLAMLCDLQLGLAPRYRYEEFLYTKLFHPCKKNQACELACFKPASTLEGLITDLRASLSLKNNNKNSQYLANNLDSYYTDRRYKSRPVNSKNVTRQSQHTSLLPQFNSHSSQSSVNKNSTEQSKRCFICKKYGCWSSNHSDADREKHRKNWQRDMQNRANRRYDQYLVEGYDDDQEDEDEQIIDDAIIEALTSNTDSYQIEDNENTMQHTFFGETDGKGLLSTIADLSIQHMITSCDVIQNSEPIEMLTSSVSRYDDRHYHGIMIDTGAASNSTAGYKQYLAYKRINANIDTHINTSKGKSTNIKFGIGITTPIGTLGIYTAFGYIEFFVVKADTPFLFSLQDMDRLGVYYNNVENVLIQGTRVFLVIRRWDHPFLLEKGLNANDLSSSAFFNFDCFFTSQEIRQLHRRFGHPSAKRLIKVLEKSGYNVSLNLVEKLTKFCSTCQKHGRSPRRFKFTLRDDTLSFNHTVYIDIIYIKSSSNQTQSSPVLNVVDEAIGFQAGRWLSNMSSQTVWNALRHCWIDTYSGPPNFLVHDAVEVHHSIGIVERYHMPVRRAYECLHEDLPDLSKETILQMAFKAKNDIFDPGGLVPTLLVFGCYPRMSCSDPPQPSIAKRATAIRQALRQRNGPNVEIVKDLPINSDVLVWRDNPNSKSWEGPFKLLGLEADTCQFQLPSGPTDFRITSVKPFLNEIEPLAPVNENETAASEPQVVERRNPGRNRRLPARYNDSITFFNAGLPKCTIPVEPWGTQKSEARCKELNDLQEKGAFSIIDINQIPQSIRIFGSRWVDTIKNENMPMAFAKARLVIQGYNDSGKKEILTQSPTIQRASQDYFINRSYVYVQATTPIRREIYTQPPAELGLDKSKILKIQKPLYGLAESGNHWYVTYHSHHTKTLGMTPSTYDSCLLYRNIPSTTINENFSPFGISGLQTDDTLFLANLSFAKLEQNKMTFLCKERERLTNNHNLKFNGSLIQLEKGTINLSQKSQCDKIKSAIDKNSYIAQRARGAYVATMCQPEATYDLSFAAQIRDPQITDIQRLNRRLTWQQNNSLRGLKFIPLDISTLKLVVFTDSSFATNPDYSSQLGYVIALVDGE
ncbi:hypothetical protein EPUL_004867 [Erysiphe pulchra]|uniref:Integrase catalytic domain-containing protein n=1 Tax=Erysiphe pulchra TaxID=225359 RepID=A0A2S4PR70_9PEZI|nr:hypothetical protein EPUL_004867 [Erysiphe pulchra]